MTVHIVNEPARDPFIALCGEAAAVLNDVLVGKGGQSVCGSDRGKVHAALGNISDMVVAYVNDKARAKIEVR